MSDIRSSIIKISTLLRKADGLDKERLKAHGLKDLQTYVLIHLNLIENPSQRILCEKFKVPKQTINNVINDLKKQGLIELKEDSKDKRKKIISLTQKGIEKRSETINLLDKSAQMIYEDIGEQEVDKIIENLEILTKSLKNNIKRKE